MLTASVANDSTNSGVTWSVSGASCTGSGCGVLSQTTSTSAVYTAPATGGVYVVTATSVANSTATASAQFAVTDLGGVFTYRNNLTAAGINAKEYLLTPANVNSTSFGKLFSCTVDESVYAEPLWVANAAIAGGTHNIVIIATQNDSVYAFDADGANGTSCILYWQASLLTPSYGAASDATPIPPADTGEPHDISNEIGITSTPVIDPATNILYVESNTKENGSYYQRLHALNLSTGAENTSWPITIAASVAGTGDGSSGGTLPFIPLHENQRPGLALVNGSVYMGFGSHGDYSPWHGWVIGYNTSTRALSGALATTPNTSGGGIWMAGSTPAVDSNNNLYVISSNGTYDGNTEFGDSFLKLSTTSGLSIADWFTPYNQSNLDAGNLDLGQGGAITLLDSVSGPYPHLLIGGGKDGVLYLLNRDNMGKYNSSNNNAALQTWSLGGGSNFSGIASAGIFWQNTFYIAASGNPMQAYAFDTSTDLFNTIPTSQSTNAFGFPGATPEISASGTTNAILWAVDTYANGTNGAPTGPAVLHAYDATNLATELWNSTQSTPQGASNQAPNAVKFVIPTVANGKVYVGGVDGFAVYGLLNLYQTAASPTFSPAPGAYSSSASVTLSDASPGATIYYTTDGTPPTTASNVYSSPINISTTTTITAMAIGPGLTYSPPASGTYTILPPGTSVISYVQGEYSDPGSATTVTVNYTLAQTAGDLNVVVVGWNDTTASVGSVVDSSGNAYTLAVGPTQAGGMLSQAIYYAKNIAAAAAGTNTITVTFTQAASHPDIRILEYSGADTISPLDVTSANTGSGTVGTSGTATTTNPVDLLFGANITTGMTSGPGTGYTKRLLTSPDTDIAEDQFVSATGSYSATAPSSPSTWIMQLAAFRAAGSSTDTTPPTAPGNLTATGSVASASLSWTASTDNVGVAGYSVYRSTTSGFTPSSSTLIGTTTATSYVDSGLAAGTYYYLVTAYDTAGNVSSPSNQASATVTADTTPPSAPSNLTATAASATSINLSWTASTDNVGVTGYLVQRCQGSGCTNFVQIGTTAGTITTYSNTGLTASTSYSYQVQATDAAGNLSSFSNIASATTPATSSVVTYVQGAYATPHTPQTTVAVNFNAAQAVGDLNVVVVGWNDTTASVGSVVDSSGNTYTLAVGPTQVSGKLSQSIYYAKNIAAAAAGTNTVTVTFTQAAAYPDIRILEYSSADTTSPLDVTAANVGSSSPSNSGPVTTKNATDLLFGANITTGMTSGPGTGYTSRLLTSPDGDIAEDEFVTAIGSYSATAPASGTWIMQLVAFKAAP